MIRSFNTAIMSDVLFRDQSLLARFLFMALYNHQQNHFCGLFQLGVDELAAHVRATREETLDALAELVRNGWVEADFRRCLYWLPEMRRALGTGRISDAQQGAARKYLESLRPCALVKKVGLSLGIHLPIEIPEETQGGTLPGTLPPTVPQTLPRTVRGTPLSVTVSGSGSATESDPEILPGRSSPDPVREEHAGQGIGPSTGLSLAQGPAHQDPGALPDAHGDRGRDPGRGPAQASTDPGSCDRIGTQGGLPGLVPIAATQKPQKATRKPKPRGEEPPALTNATWAAYAAAFVRRHKTDPRRNGRVNGQLARFIELVGAEDAPGIAAHYVANGSAFYVTQMHPVGLMLRDAEKLAAEWQRGDHVSAAQARRNEQTAANPFLNMPCREDGDE